MSAAQFTPAQALSIWPGQPVERAQGAALRVPDGIHGMVLYGPGLSVAPGLYRVHARAQAEGSHDASPLFDVSAETRIFASRLSHEGWEVFVHLYATEALEFRFQARGGGFTIEGVELEPLLLDADPSDAATVRALLDRLTEGWGEADARFRLIDRLAAFGHVDEAEQYRARYVGGQGRVGAKIRVAFADLNTPGGLPSGYEPFEASWKQIEALLDHYPLHEVDLLRLGPAERADLLSRGYQPDFLYATWRHRDYAEPPRVWREHADPTLNAAEFTSRPPLFERRVDIDRSHQASLAREEGMVAYCPVSGRELRSRHGFLQHFYGLPFVFYRFEGVEVFYVCTGHVSSAKSFVYIPRTGTVVHIGDTWLRSKPPAGVIRRFNVNLVHFRDKVRQYLGRPSTPAAVVGSDNLGHYFWTNFSGLQYASENGLLDKVAEVIELSRTFASPALAFEELADKPRHAFDIDVLAFEHCLDRALLPIHFTDLIITDALADRIERMVEQHASPAGRPPEDVARPLIWLNIRAHNKVWLDQVEGYARILNATYDEYGAASAFLDGMPDCAEIAAAIRARTRPEVQIYEGFRLSVVDSIRWAFAIDAYICIISSSMVMTNWLANKPGVAHAEHSHMDQMNWWDQVRPTARRPLTPAPGQITDVGSGLYCDYRVHWKVLYSLLQQALGDTSLQPRRRSPLQRLFKA